MIYLFLIFLIDLQNLTFKLANTSDPGEKKVDIKESPQPVVRTTGLGRATSTTQVKFEPGLENTNSLTGIKHKELDKIDIVQISENESDGQSLFSIDFNLEINNR